MEYLVDTGVWLRLFDRSDPEHAAIRAALRLLRSNGHTVTACPQNIAEFWNVSTRPASSHGGYGKSVATTGLCVQFIERNARILDESAAAYRHWRGLLAQHQIQGLAVHDARLVSMMGVAGISRILTLNVADFARYPGIVALAPNTVGATVTQSNQPQGCHPFETAAFLRWQYNNAGLMHCWVFSSTDRGPGRRLRR
jgi:predicted nucleic acid-binding protein